MENRNINRDNSLRSRISVRCKKEGGRTVLAESYFDIPYKLQHYGSSQANEYLEMIQMCSSPGIMDGDSLTLEIHCEENTEMRFYTQSYNKVHPMPKQKGAEQHCSFHLGKNAILHYNPHPTIPYKDSIFKAINQIEMDFSSHLIWSDIIAGGRIYAGELFEFDRFHTITKIFVDQKLIVFDNQLIAPKSQPLDQILFFEGYSHQGTMMVVSRFAEGLKKELDEILQEQFSDSAYGYTMCSDNALMIRILGESGDVIHEWMNNIGAMAWSYLKFYKAEIPSGDNRILENAKSGERKRVEKNTISKKETALKKTKNPKQKMSNP